jgi:DNA-binding NtrC family response regulator
MGDGAIPDFGFVLIVEDDARMRATLARLFERRARVVLAAGTVVEAKALLSAHRVELVVLDVRLKGESGLEVATFASGLVPAPAVIAVSGAAGPEEAFALAQLGVRAYIPKAEIAARIHEIVELARDVPPLAPVVKAQVGRHSVREVQEVVRDAMLDQALALERGNLSGAAKRLGVTRQAVQQMARRRFKDE